MLFAVNMPEHEPQPGQAESSKSASSDSANAPAWYFPTASNTELRSMSAPSFLPVSMGPPETTTLGMLSLAAAISMPGTILSQLVTSTSASRQCASAIVSIESAMSSREASAVFHSRVAHRDAVADADGGELDRRPARAPDARLHGVRDRAEVDMAGDYLVFSVDDADKRPVELLVGIAHRLEQRAVRSALHALLDLVAPHFAASSTALTTASPMALVPTELLAGRLTGNVGAAETRVEDGRDGILDRLRRGLELERVPDQERRGQDRRERVGFVLAGDVGRRAVDRLVQAAGRATPRLALASMPIDPVIMLASSESMSPNMLLVAMTSNWRGFFTSCIAALSTYMKESSMQGQRGAIAWAVSRHSRDDSRILALSTGRAFLPLRSRRRRLR